MNGNINMYSSFEYDVMRQSICIHTDAGRCIRPLLRVENGGVVVAKYLDKIQQITWDSLLTNCLDLPEQCIDYIDCHEINSLLLSNTPDELRNSTHCEIHPSLILGEFGFVYSLSSSQSSSPKHVSISYGKASLRDSRH